MLKIISLFSGIGGLDFGFEQAGFETRVALEFNRHACQAMRLNRPSWEVIEEDINLVSSEILLSRAGLTVGEADVLIGGPPCQPFSKSGYWARGDALRLDDPRADTLTAYLRILRDTQPKAFLLENVFGLAYQGKDEGLRYILDGIKQINQDTGSCYEVTWQVINCASYGVPQLRERVFMVGARSGKKFRFPDPTHGPQQELGQDFFDTREPYRTAWDAIGDLSALELTEEGLRVGGKWGDLLPSIPEGENYLWHTDRSGGKPLFGWRTRFWSFLLKLSKKLPSWTIQAQPGSAVGPFHWTNRRLTFAELCRLQTFPDGLALDCGRTEMQRMLGNAVPSLVAEVVAKAIKAQLLNLPIDSHFRLLPPKRTPVPPPEPLQPLLEKYEQFIGVHEAHPGTGLGRSFRAVKPETELVTA